MIIPNTLSHLHNKHALILVCGSNVAYIYEIKNSQCNLIQEITPSMLESNNDASDQTTLDTDRKGHTRTWDKAKKNLYRERLIKLIGESISIKIPENPQEIFIFCPKRIGEKIMENHESSDKIIIGVVRYGNYTKFHPINLLKQIQQLLEDRLIIQ